MPSLVIVSNRLPVSVKKVDGKLEFSPSIGGLATGLSSYTTRRGTKWIGWPGLPSDDLTEAERARISRELRKHRCYPVFLTRKQLDDYYNGYSNSVLWPLFHDLPVKPHTARQWQAYRKVNGIFADEVLRLSRPGSTIWVHDYQLLLVPQLLRQAGRDDRIGYFLHIPFPAPKVFAQTEEAKSMLRGMLGADLVGFHTKGYTRHFLAACKELLGLDNQHGQLLLGERPIRAAEFPIGIDYARFAAATRRRGNRQELRALRRRYKGLRVIVDVGRLDPSKGIAERLEAYRRLLKQRPELRGKVILVMIVAPSRTEVAEYKALKKRLDTLLANIDREFATPRWQPVDFIYEVMPLERIMQYYQIAQVAFITPLRDGMNLVAKEFIASKRHNDGVLVLSETAGAAEELRGAILVNPKKPQTMVDGLVRALQIPKREWRRRARDMQAHIQQFSVQKWADSFMDSLQQPLKLTPRPVRSLSDQQAQAIITAYAQAGSRLLLLDYDGVLRRLATTPAAATPASGTLKLLKRLSQDARNEIVVISGRDKTDLANWFGDLPVALAAEHGALFRRRGGKNWHRTSSSGSAWQREVKTLFAYYVGTTPGAFTEQKEWSIAWHYRLASPYYAQKHLVTLRRLLKPIAKRYNLVIQEGHKVIEVHPADVSKGRVVREWLVHDHDFILCVGDDTTDEDMFAALPASAFSIKVGRGQTLARYRLKDVPAVLRLLGKL